MAKNLSAMKKLQVSSRNRLRNKIYKSSVKTLIKKTLNSIYNNTVSQEVIKNNLSQAYSQIDKAIKRGVIPKNQGSRRKSKLLREYKKYNILNS